MANGKSKGTKCRAIRGEGNKGRRWKSGRERKGEKEKGGGGAPSLSSPFSPFLPFPMSPFPPAVFRVPRAHLRSCPDPGQSGGVQVFGDEAVPRLDLWPGLNSYSFLRPHENHTYSPSHWFGPGPRVC